MFLAAQCKRLHFGATMGRPDATTFGDDPFIFLKNESVFISVFFCFSIDNLLIMLYNIYVRLGKTFSNKSAHKNLCEQNILTQCKGFKVIYIA